MSNKALNWARKLPLKAGEKSILNAIADSYNDKKGCCYLKIKHIMARTGYSESTVKRHLKSLRSKNLVQKSEVRNQFGHRITSKYTMIFDYNLNILGVILACGKLGSLSVILTGLSVILTWPKCHFDTKHYINNHKYNHKITMDNSLVDNFFEQNEQTKEHEKIKIQLEEAFVNLCKIYEDSYNLENARRLFFKICLEKEHPLNFAYNLISARKQQICYFKKLINSGRPTPTPTSILKWLEGKRWLDIVKPFEQLKKKISPYLKCKICGEEYLRGSHCQHCEELKKPRLSYG